MIKDKDTRTDWEKWEDKFKTISQNSTRPISPILAKTIISLNCMGIYTSSSSNGNLNREIYGPYINCSLNDEDETLIKFVDKWSEAHTAARELKREKDITVRNDNEVNTMMLEAHELRKMVLKKTIKKFGAPLMKLINEFYRDRPRNSDARIVLQENGYSNFRIESQGVCLQSGRELKNQKNKLEVYQDEMSKFGGFIKNKNTQ